MTAELPRPEEAALARNYGAQLEACERLVAVVWIERPSNSEIKEFWQAVIASILGRGISTFRGAIQLCRVGLPTQGLMLARPLFEDSIAVMWAEVHKDVLRERIRAKEDHQTVVEHRIMESLRQRSGKSSNPLPTDLTEREVELDKLFGRGGSRSWFGDLWTALTEVEDLWEQRGGESGRLRDYYNVLNRIANDRLHNTVEGLRGGARGTSSRPRNFGYGQAINVDDDEMERALNIAPPLFGLLAESAIRGIRGSESQAVAACVRELRATVAKLSPGALQGVGRNDPCPCGSGQKLKRCHGL